MGDLKNIKGNLRLPLLVRKIEIKESSSKKTYQKLLCRDDLNNESYVYNWEEKNFISNEVPCLVEAVLCEENGYMSLKEIKKIKGDITPYFPKSSIDIEVTYNSLLKEVNKLEYGFKDIVEYVYKKHKNDFYFKPLTESGAYSEVGGVLAATSKLVDITKKIVELYPSDKLDKNLILSSALLYNVGVFGLIDKTMLDTEDKYLIGFTLSSGYVIKAAYDSVDKKTKELYNAFRLITHTVTHRYGNASIPEALILANVSKMITDLDNMLDVLSSSDDVIIGKYINKERM